MMGWWKEFKAYSQSTKGMVSEKRSATRRVLSLKKENGEVRVRNYSIYSQSVIAVNRSSHEVCSQLVCQKKKNLSTILIIQNNLRSYFSFLKPYPSFYTRIWVRGMEIEISDTITPTRLTITTIPVIS